jgi:hypothetical protein
MTAHATREAWLIAAAGLLAPLLEEVGEEMVPIRVSVGWPGGRGKKSTTVGQCWNRASSADEVNQIFLSPVRGEEDTIHVLGTLLHEMIHAIDDCNGHRGNFARIAKAVGFLPKLTSADNRTEALTATLADVGETLGAFPHAAMVGSARGSEEKPKQSTRMLKVICGQGDNQEELGEGPYLVRMTQKWLDLYGPPTCPCHGADMEVAS